MILGSSTAAPHPSCRKARTSAAQLVTVLELGFNLLLAAGCEMLSKAREPWLVMMAAGTVNGLGMSRS